MLDKFSVKNFNYDYFIKKYNIVFEEEVKGLEDLEGLFVDLK